jgi:hypothetical protein
MPMADRTRAGNKLLHHPAAGSLPDLDHGLGELRHLDVFESPLEKLSVECLGFIDVGAVQFDVNKRV